jgi:hypothetical protein
MDVKLVIDCAFPLRATSVQTGVLSDNDGIQIAGCGRDATP